METKTTKNNGLDEDKMRVGLIMDRNEWKTFKKVCKKLNTDSSKEIRKFIQKYLEENQNIINTLF